MMKKHWFQKGIAVALAGAMTLGLLTGCGSPEKDNGETNRQEASGSSPEQEGGKTPEESGKTAEREKLVIAIQTYNTITDYDDNYLTKRLEEELGIDIEFHLLSAEGTEAATQLSLMMTAGQDLPDIICTAKALTSEAILEYGSKGVLLPLQDMLNDPETAPNFNSVVEQEDRLSMLAAATSADGNVYSMVSFAPNLWNKNPYRFYINQVWLDELNLPMPTTTEEYYETLKAFVTKDPNGNGVADEIGVYGYSQGSYGENVTIALMNSFIFYPQEMSSVARLTLDKSGEKVIAPFVEDEWRKGLEYMNRLCQEGLLPASIFTDDKTQFMATLNNEEVNLVGSVTTGSLARWNDFDNNANGQQYEMMPPLEGPDGVAWSSYLEYVPKPIWFVTSSCKNPELAVKLGDLFYDQDMSIIVRFGEPEVDWTRDPEALNNPNYGNTYIDAGVSTERLFLVVNNIWGENNAKFWRDINPRYVNSEFTKGVIYAKERDPENKTQKFEVDNLRYNYSAHPEKLLPELIYTAEEASAQAEIRANVSSYMSQSMAQFITGERPLTDKEWEAYKKELDNMGLQTWINNAQAAYTRMK